WIALCGEWPLIKWAWVAFLRLLRNEVTYKMRKKAKRRRKARMLAGSVQTAPTATRSHASATFRATPPVASTGSAGDPVDDLHSPEAPPPAGPTLPRAKTDAELTHPDGPEGGRWLWWKGKRHDIPAGVAYRMIEFMWNRDSASYDELVGKVFDDPVE